MDIESKIWIYSVTGTKVHAFLNGVALCRNSIRRHSEKNALDYCEAKRFVSLCTACVKKFDAAIERAENSMRPSTGDGDHLQPAREEETASETPKTAPYTCPPEERRRSGTENHYTECLISERKIQMDLEEQLRQEAAQREAERVASEQRAAQALKDAQAALDQSGVSIPPGAWGH